MSAMSVFHINTTIKLKTGMSDNSHIHFAFATEQASSVEQLQDRLESGKGVFGWRLVTRRTGERNIIKSKVATFLTIEGIAMIQDWTRGTLEEEEEAD